MNVLEREIICASNSRAYQVMAGMRVEQFQEHANSRQDSSRRNYGHCSHFDSPFSSSLFVTVSCACRIASAEKLNRFAKSSSITPNISSSRSETCSELPSGRGPML